MGKTRHRSNREDGDDENGTKNNDTQATMDGNVLGLAHLGACVTHAPHVVVAVALDADVAAVVTIPVTYAATGETRRLC